MAEHAVTIELLGRQLHIACPKGHEESLERSAERLDKMIEQVKERSQTRSEEKVLLMAALNLCHELITLEQTQSKTNAKLEVLLAQLLHANNA
jgi:cell division protein ZapA